MKTFDKCHVCGGDLRTKTVEKLVRGGNNIASIKVKADVCLKCGERIYRKEDISRFEEIEQNLLTEQVGSYVHLGRSFYVP